MQWIEQAFVLHVARFGEHALRVVVLSRSHGVYHGIVKFGAKKRSIYDSGNLIHAKWSARLSEHMGTLNGELETPYSARVMHDAQRLNALAETCRLIRIFLPERVPETPVYDAFSTFIEALVHKPHWQADYVQFEHRLLAAIGYGLDLERCAATGSQADLIYVSPKTGRAVSREAGAPYHNRLLALPQFLLDGTLTPTHEEIHQGHALSRFFFERASRDLHREPWQPVEFIKPTVRELTE